MADIAATAASPTPEARAIPRKSHRKKRKRFDAWNAFVKMNPPAPTDDAQAVIRRGDHLKDLSQRWAALSTQEHERYARLASAELAARDSSVDGGDNAALASDFRGPW
eukprot:7223661-Alexandrium_andersonii.AAC.1